MGLVGFVFAAEPRFRMRQWGFLGLSGIFFFALPSFPRQTRIPSARAFIVRTQPVIGGWVGGSVRGRVRRKDEC